MCHMNGILIYLILFLKNIEKIGDPYSFPKREDMVKDNQSSHVTIPLKDSDKRLRMCCVRLPPTDCVVRVAHLFSKSIVAERSALQPCQSTVNGQGHKYNFQHTQVYRDCCFGSGFTGESGFRHFSESGSGYQNKALLNPYSIRMRILTICPWFIHI